MNSDRAARQQAALAAARARGAAQADPVRWCFIEALARRAAAQDGRVAELLEARLTLLLDAGPDGPLRHADADADTRTAPPAPASASASTHETRDPHAGPGALAALASPARDDAPTLEYFRATWARFERGATAVAIARSAAGERRAAAFASAGAPIAAADANALAGLPRPFHAACRCLAVARSGGEPRRARGRGRHEGGRAASARAERPAARATARPALSHAEPAPTGAHRAAPTGSCARHIRRASWALCPDPP